jgi:hypothetical protein
VHIVSIVIYIVAALFIVLAVGLVFAYYRERQPGTLLMAVIYGTAAGVAIALTAWVPLAAGFVVAWVVRLMGLEPPPRDGPQS